MAYTVLVMALPLAWVVAGVAGVAGVVAGVAGVAATVAAVGVAVGMRGVAAVGMAGIAGGGLAGDPAITLSVGAGVARTVAWVAGALAMAERTVASVDRGCQGRRRRNCARFWNATKRIVIGLYGDW